MAARPSSFGVAFAVLPAPQRDAIRAVHAWSRAVDDGVDEEADPGVARGRIAGWRREVEALFDGDPTEPATRALKPHVARFRIPRSHFEDLVSGVEMDLSRATYETFQDLSRYCYRVASVVGLICLHIFGDDEERGRGYAEDLGIALQLTNILRDLGSDLRRGRVYLPAEERRQFGYSDEALARGERNDAFQQLMCFQAARARAFFASAEREGATLPRRMVAAEIMARVYRRLLERIEDSRFDVFRREIRVPRHERVWIAATTALSRPNSR
jgi:phytoene synthase